MISPLNNKEFFLMFEDNSKMLLQNLINEASHYHEFLKPLEEQLMKIVHPFIEEKIKNLKNGVEQKWDETFEFNTEYTNNIKLILNYYWVEDYERIIDPAQYRAVYFNKNGLKDGKLDIPTITMWIPILQNTGGATHFPFMFDTILSHELTHLYDDWMELTNDKLGVNYDSRRVNPNIFIYFPEGAVKELLKISYFIDKPEQKAFIQMMYREFQKVNLSRKNYQSKIKETLGYKNYNSIITKSIPIIKDATGEEIYNTMKKHEDIVNNKGIPTYNSQKDKSFDEYKERIINWCEYQTKQFLKKLGGIVVYYMNNLNEIAMERLNKKIIISERQLNLIREEILKEEEVTFYQFISELKSFLRSLLENPVSCKVGMFWKSRGFSKNKLVEYLLKIEVLEKQEKVNTDNPEQPELEVSYKVLRKGFERKMKKMFIRLFEGETKESTKMILEAQKWESNNKFTALDVCKQMHWKTVQPKKKLTNIDVTGVMNDGIADGGI